MRDGDLFLRPFGPADAAALEAIMAEPEVGRWWVDGDYASEHGWMLEVDRAPAGWLEFHEELHEWFPSVAFDIFLTSPLHGRGYGRRALGLAIEHFAGRGHHRFTLDPNAANERAIRCYRSLGFEPVGVMRDYERNRHGGWSDALLMELIRHPAGS
jgi:aminoglycoside 6'-N-acetyltransferase